MTKDNTGVNFERTESANISERSAGKIARNALQLGGIIPGVGGFFAAAAGIWSECAQDKANAFFEYCISMLQDQFKEQAITIVEIMARLDLQDEKIVRRIQSDEFQSLVKKALRDWSAAEEESKRQYVRNILANAASCDMTGDDVVRLFIDWLKRYSALHFRIVGAVYNDNGISRGEIWEKMKKPVVREDSADADLYKLVIHELSLGHIIRQCRKKDYNGAFLVKSSVRQRKSSSAIKQMKSAFDREEGYELTSLGEQFVHYAMTDLPLKIAYEDTI